MRRLLILISVLLLSSMPARAEDPAVASLNGSWTITEGPSSLIGNPFYIEPDGHFEHYSLGDALLTHVKGNEFHLNYRFLNKTGKRSLTPWNSKRQKVCDLSITKVDNDTLVVKNLGKRSSACEFGKFQRMHPLQDESKETDSIPEDATQ